jgi:hypothetical protein
MTSIADRGYDAYAQGFPEGYDRAESEFQIAVQLRPFYRRSAQLDRDRIARFRAAQGDTTFDLPDRLWPPGGGSPPGVRSAASAGPRAAEMLAHYCALRDADLEAREQAEARQAAADAKTLTCSCCGTADPTTRPRGGTLDTLDVSPFGGPRLCDRCAQLIRRAYRARLDADADRAALEDTPAGPRGQACDAWLNAALGGQDR